jgi:hypothetical protein
MRLTWAPTLCFVMVATAFSGAFAQTAATTCSLATLKGGYGLTYTGEIINGGPVGVIARTVFDGAGNLKQHDHAIVNGNIFGGEETGTYTMRPDCTGTLTIVFTGGGSLDFDFVLDDNAREIRAVSQSPGTNTTFTGRKQFVN